MLRCLLFGSHFLWPCAGEFPQGNFDFGVFRSFWFEYVLRLRCWFFSVFLFFRFFSPVTLYHFGLSCVFSCYILWVRRKKPNKYTHTHISWNLRKNKTKWSKKMKIFYVCIVNEKEGECGCETEKCPMENWRKTLFNWFYLICGGLGWLSSRSRKKHSTTRERQRWIVCLHHSGSEAIVYETSTHFLFMEMKQKKIAPQ